MTFSSRNKIRNFKQTRCKAAYRENLSKCEVLKSNARKFSNNSTNLIIFFNSTMELYIIKTVDKQKVKT